MYEIFHALMMFFYFIWKEFDISDDYCGTYGDINTPIAGTRPVEANAVIRFEETSATSIAVTVTHDYTVAFIGTDKGNLKKVGQFSIISMLILGIILLETGIYVELF